MLVEEATPEDLDRTFQYVLEEGDPEIASNAIVLVDATTQYSRPSSCPGSAAASLAPPVIGLRGSRSDHYGSGAGLRAPSSTRFSASAARLRGQRAAFRPSSSPGAPGSAPAHSVFGRRRASVRASSQRQQVLLGDFLTLLSKQTRPHLGSQRPRHRSIAA